MNIILAQLIKDIRCQRGPLILWVICLGLGVFLVATVATLAHLDHSHWQNPELSDTQKIVGVLSVVAFMVTCTSAVAFGMFLLLPILVIRIVQEDTLMGTTAFWMTRPIPRGKLMLAKVLFIAVLLAPLVVAGEDNTHIGTAHFWTSEISWIVTVAALASITPGVQPLLGYGLAFLFGKIIFSGSINRLWIHYHGAGSAFSDGITHQFSSAMFTLHLNEADFLNLCYLAGFAGVFIHQYLTLRTRKSIAIFAATLVIVSLMQMLAGPSVNPSTSPVIRINSSSTTWQTP